MCSCSYSPVFLIRFLALSFLSPLNPFTGYLRPNLEYTVWYRLADAHEWRIMRIIQKNVMEATIPNLQPGREYEFMVLSQDKYGDGMFSKPFRYPTQRKFLICFVFRFCVLLSFVFARVLQFNNAPFLAFRPGGKVYKYC